MLFGTYATWRLCIEKIYIHKSVLAIAQFSPNLYRWLSYLLRTLFAFLLALAPLNLTGCFANFAIGKIETPAVDPGGVPDDNPVEEPGNTIPSIAFSDGTDTYDHDKTPIFTWTEPTGNISEISHYEIALGSTSGGTEVMTWTNVGKVTSFQKTGLNLTPGLTYYGSLRAAKVSGEYSTVNVGNGWVVNSELWTTNGTVNTIFKKGNTLYLGGSFTEIMPWSGGGAPVNPATGLVSWPDSQNKARVTGQVLTAIPDASGGFYIGGNFSRVGAFDRTDLAHILADGTVDPQFNATTNNYIQSMVLSTDGTILYVGGAFTEINSTTRRNLAAINATTGALVMGFDPNSNNIVSTLALSPDGNTLYLGGDFTDLNGGTIRNHIGAVTTSNGLVTSFNPNANGVVYSMALTPDGNTLYLAGNFTDLNSGTIRNRIAAVSTASSTATAFNPNANNFINSIVLNSTGTVLYLGGAFTTLNGGVVRNYVGAVTTADGIITAFNPQASLWVNKVALSPDQNTVYLGGSFSALNGTTRYSVGSVDSTTGAVNPNFDPNANQWVSAIATNSTGNVLYLGGAFMKLNSGTLRTHVAAIDTTTGTVVSGFNPNPNPAGIVKTIATSPDGGTVYLGGIFTTMNGGSPRNRIAAVNASNGLLINDFNPNANNSVGTMTMSSDGQTLYLGGDFTTLNGGITRNRIAAVSTATGLLVSTFDPNANNSITTMALSPEGNTLYIGGDFTALNGGTTRNRLAAISTATGLLVSAFDPNANNSVTTMTLSPEGNTLYIGGDFTALNGGTTRNRIAAVGTATGLLVSTFDPNANNSVTTMALSPDGQTLYLGGKFSTVNGGVATGALVAVNPVTGLLKTEFAPGVVFWIYSLCLNNDGSTVFIGGMFLSMFKGGPANLAPVNTSTGLWAH
jgi:hypothetical protein